MDEGLEEVEVEEEDIQVEKARMLHEEYKWGQRRGVWACSPQTLVLQ